jgi:hypothetical protein
MFLLLLEKGLKSGMCLCRAQEQKREVNISNKMIDFFDIILIVKKKLKSDKSITVSLISFHHGFKKERRHNRDFFYGVAQGSI